MGLGTRSRPVSALDRPALPDSDYRGQRAGPLASAVQPKLDDDCVDRETGPEGDAEELPGFEMRQPARSEKYTHDWTGGSDAQKYSNRPRNPAHVLKRLATTHIPIRPCEGKQKEAIEKEHR